MNNQNSLVRILNEAYNRGHWNAHHQKPEQMLDPEMKDLLAAINKTIMESLPEKKQQPTDPKAIRYNEDALEGYNQAISDMEQALAKKYGRAE